MRKRLPVVVAAALLIASCGSGDAETTGPTATTDPTSSSRPGAVSTTSEPAVAITPPTTTTTTTVAGEALLAGLEPITPTTPASGGGIRPELAWEPLADADHYAVYLYAPNGRMYWSWRGRESSVPVGGRPALPDAATGPSVAEGMTWAVVAYDAGMQPIGSSAVVPIAP